MGTTGRCLLDQNSFLHMTGLSYQPLIRWPLGEAKTAMTQSAQELPRMCIGGTLCVFPIFVETVVTTSMRACEPRVAKLVRYCSCLQSKSKQLAVQHMPFNLYVTCVVFFFLVATNLKLSASRSGFSLNFSEERIGATIRYIIP